MAGIMEENAVVALENLYSGPMKDRELARSREIFAFLQANGQGKVLERAPSVDGGATVLDIVALFDAITKRGGVRHVREQSLWKEVITDMGYPFDRQTLVAVSMHYNNFLYAYEQATFGARPEVSGQTRQKSPQPPHTPQQQQQQQARAGQVGGRVQQLDQLDQYQRHLRQREFEQQQLRQQRQLELQQQMEEKQRQHKRKEEEEQERKRKVQEQQRHLVKQQQQQQLQMEQQQLFLQQQKRQQAQHQMIFKQQQHMPQHHRGQTAPYQAAHHHRHAAFSRPPGGESSYMGNAFPYGNSRMRSSGPGGVSASIPRGDLPRALTSMSSPREVVAAVNSLTLETYDSPEELVLEDIPGLFDAILDLMDRLNPAVTQVITLAQKLRSRLPKGAESTLALLDAAFGDTDGLGGVFGDSSYVGLPPSGRGELLLLLLNALRNASFVPSNERVIGHSARAIQHFVSLCSAISPDAAVFAATLDLFGRVTKHVDIWGRRAAETDYDGCKWAEDSLCYLVPAHVRMESKRFSDRGGRGGGITSPSVLEYVSSVALVFPTLVSMVDDEERSRVLSALAILSKLSQMETNKEAFDRVPDGFLRRLVELLSIPKLGCDVLATKAGVSSQEWLEYNCRVLHPVDAGSDEEVRDSALEVMSLLAGLSDNLRSRLGSIPGCARTLTNLVIANTRGIRIDPQARRMAALTLTSLGAVESNHPCMKPLYSDLLVAAARDPHTAELLFHGLKAVFSP